MSQAQRMAWPFSITRTFLMVAFDLAIVMAGLFALACVWSPA